MTAHEARPDPSGGEGSQASPGRRHTFVLQVRPNGVSTLQNARTGEHVAIEELDAVGDVVERWITAFEQASDTKERS